jgi:hypothetical protein
MPRRHWRGLDVVNVLEFRLQNWKWRWSLRRKLQHLTGLVAAT